MRALLSRVAGVLGWSWLVLVVGLYAYTQGYAGAGEERALLLFGWIALACVSAGARLLAWIDPPGLAELERWVFSAALGAGGLMLAVFGMAWIGWLEPAALLGVLSLFLLLGIDRLWPGLVRLWLWGRAQLGPAWRADRALAAVVAAIALSWSFLQFAAPPTFYDSIVYHLALPSQYLIAGRYVPMADNLYAHLPANMGMLYLLALGLAGEPLANLCNWGMGLLALLALYALTREHLGRAAARLTLALAAALPLVQFLLQVPKDDLAFCAFAFGGVSAALHARARCSRRLLALSAILLGLALGTRYFAAYLLVALAAVLGLHWLHGRGLRLLRAAPLAFGLLLLVDGPWLARNALESGNPIDPALSGWFGRPEDNCGIRARWRETDPYLGPEQAWLADPRRWPDLAANLLVVLPWDLTLHGRLFDSLLGFLTPLPLALLPLMVRFRPIPAAGRSLALMSAIYFGFWAFDFPYYRYLLPGVLLLLPLVGWVGVRLAGQSGVARLAIAAAWSISLVSALVASFDVTRAAAGPDAYLVTIAPAHRRQQTRRIFLERRLPTHGLIEAINRMLPADAVVLFTGEIRTHYSRRAARFNSHLDCATMLRAVEASATPAQVAGRLRALGITHLVWGAQEASRLHRATGYLSFSTAEKEALFFEFLRAQTPLFRDPGGTLVALQPG